MKVLIATGLYPPEVGGPATYAKALNDALPERGIEVMVLPFREVRAAPKVLRHILYFFRVFGQSRNVDVVFAQDPVSVGLPTLWAARLRRKRFLLRVGGDYAWEQGVHRFGVEDSLDVFVEKHEEYPFFVRLLKRIQAYVGQNAEQVIVPSHYLQRIVSLWGISVDRISVIESAFEPPHLRESKDELRETLRLRGRVILSAGRLVPWKGFDTLIGLLPDVIKKFPDTQLLIAGSGPEQERLNILARDMRIIDHVQFLGDLPQELLNKYIKAADVFVLNTFYEGFSHMLLEVMALETPIITTPAGGNPELITHRREGFLVDYNDRKALTSQIKRVLGGTASTKRLLERAYEKAHQFTNERMIEKTIAVLRNTN